MNSKDPVRITFQPGSVGLWRRARGAGADGRRVWPSACWPLGTTAPPFPLSEELTAVCLPERSLALSPGDSVPGVQRENLPMGIAVFIRREIVFLDGMNPRTRTREIWGHG